MNVTTRSGHAVGRWPTLALMVTLSAALVACGGGGGGDGDDGPPGSVDISTANREPIARTVLVSALSGSVGGSLGGLTTGGSGTPQVASAAARALTLALRGHTAAGRETRAAVVGPIQEPCAVSGSVTLSVDDQDDSQTPSVGDVLTVTFNDCSDVAGESIDGGMSARYTQIVESPLAVGATVSTSSLTVVDGQRSAALDGSFSMSLQEVNASETTLHMVVDGSLTLALQTPAITDTITMHDGYTIHTVENVASLPPGGGTAGRADITVTGNISSSAVGGRVQVSTFEPIVQYTDDEYPRSGGTEALGKTGWVRATVQSTTQVLIEIDTNGDGGVDATTTVPWTQLL